jgi:hypothetical protein
MRQPQTILAALAVLLNVGSALARAEQPVDYTREVRPLLARYCLKCHGPDPKARKGRLRLDDKEDALRDRGGYAAIVPGDADASELIVRIEDEDDASRMPPPEMKATLTPAEKDVLRRWILTGAEYRPHWAFVPPRRPALPAVKQAGWPENPIDRFVLARLEAAGLKPSPPADRYTLVRRVFLDLIGLPPTPEEADAFLGDPSPSAYSNLVDRLLASSRYGERWARRWLDLARYADTNGYEKDRPRSIWPYRDWVIKALNADMPFDQFTIEQLAGDLLPGGSLEQRIATGFHRNTMLNEEGGIDPLEFRFYAMTDRVATTGTVWLGLTIGCAQCHTHKYDPITQREYYEFFAFLDNTEEPELALPDPSVDRRRAELAAEIAALEAGLAGQFPVDPDDEGDADPATSRRNHLQRRFRTWLDDARRHTVAWSALKPVAASANLPLLTIQDDDSVFASGDQTKSDTYRVTYRGPGETDLVTAFRLDVLPDDRLPARGPGRTSYEGPKGDFFLGELRIKVNGRPLAFRDASESYGKLGIGAGKASAALACDGEAQTGWSTAGRPGEAHHAVFPLAEPITLDEASELVLEMDFGRHYAADLGRFRLSATTARTMPVAQDVPEEVERLLLIDDDQLQKTQRQRLLRHFLSVAPELQEPRKALAALRGQVPEYPTTLVMAERPPENPRPTFVHRRGEFLQPEERVAPGTLAILPPFPDESPRNRLGFARWLVDRRNPLVARVAVNRQWAALFGRGLVATGDDFGFQGQPPSHPELLDWLAVEFMDQGWSLKALHRLIVTSATYRQSSRTTPALLAKDRDNRLLARGPRIRIDAELIRDTILHATGLLEPRVGGPSVFPPQPASVTSEGAYGVLAWKASEGADRYRRALYTFSKRTAPFAMLGTFDAPSGEACVARREVSNTPLQALTLLNDTVFVEAAQALGRATADDSSPVESRAAGLFRRCLVRPPTADELNALVEFYQLQHERLAGGELDAAAIAGFAKNKDESASEGGVIDAAAWTLVARAVLNLDEMIAKE